jgi:ubiquinone/menaquinone biosynthesis C-methylase UbiE
MTGAPDIQAARAAEQAKYARIFADPAQVWYGHGEHWTDARQIVTELKPGSVLDVGTGRGHFLWWLKEHTKVSQIVGVDFASPVELADGHVVPGCEGWDVIFKDPWRTVGFRRARVEDLPFPEGGFDLVTAFDVLEHLLPDDVTVSLNEMRRVAARWLLFSIATFAHKLDGMNLHMTVRPEAWWIDTLKRDLGTKVVREGKYFLCPLN